LVIKISNLQSNEAVKGVKLSEDFPLNQSLNHLWLSIKSYQEIIK
jgi:hypothetical protein